MVKNRELVYEKAEEMAAKFREKMLAQKQAKAGIDVPVESTDADDDLSDEILEDVPQQWKKMSRSSSRSRTRSSSRSRTRSSSRSHTEVAAEAAPEVAAEAAPEVAAEALSEVEEAQISPAAVE